MDKANDKCLDRFERKAIIEAEKRKKPGECMKVRRLLLFPSLSMNQNFTFLIRFNVISVYASVD